MQLLKNVFKTFSPQICMSWVKIPLKLTCFSALWFQISSLRHTLDDLQHREPGVLASQQLLHHDNKKDSLKLDFFPLSIALSSNFAPAVNKQRHSVPPLFHREPRFSYILFQFRNQTPTVTARVAHCVIVGSIFDANQQNKTRLVNLYSYRDLITIAK